ncbi:MAG: xanthine dehydrogenase family protein molybdopterin-binding subunit [Candidatus Eremiobacteraeota bacterium]|nr:xanthine dehydrogenase family protein molybdopterin-binding subunit [Candidatus Eremiobacteraeota bacterium]
MEFKYIGKSPKRTDAMEKVTGDARFVADFFYENMLYVAILRSPHPHAKIVEIDCSKAMNIPGVSMIVCGKSIEKRCGDCICDFTPLAKDKVRYVGEPVGAVLAESPEIANSAIEHIKVVYEELPFVLTAREAMKPTSPLIHEDLGDYEVLPSFNPVPGTNVYHYYRLVKGDVEQAISQADLLVEEEFSFPHLSHAQLEPHGAIARWNQTLSNLEIITSSQSPFFVRHYLARQFGLKLYSVKVEVPYVGGGFGGKSDVTIEPLVAHIARYVPGRYVKLILTREEMFYGSVLGRGAHCIIRYALTGDGIILGAIYDIAYSCGAYGDTGINIVTGCGHNASGPYNIKNIESHCRGVYTNTPYVGAFRGYGHPEGHFMTERMIDICARKLNIDPIEMRKKNLLRPGDVNALGQIITEENGDLAGCLELVEKEIFRGEKPSSPGKIYGRAVSPLMKSPVMATNAASAAIVKINEDATANILVSGTEIGQGANTALSQIAAEILEFPLENIYLVPPRNTDFSPYEWQTVASTTTWKVGNAIIRACRDAISQFKKVAGEVFSCKPQEVIYSNMTFTKKGDPASSISIKDLCSGYKYPDGHTIGGPVIGYGYFMPEGLTYPDKETGQGNCAAEWTFGAQGVEISIDKLTGEITVHRMATAMDVGKVINPDLARAQVVGAMVQGIGGALSETIVYNSKGKIRNAAFTDYKIPAFEDVEKTEFIVKFLENPQEGGPFGARPLAEHGIVSVAPVIINAIRDAIGVDFHELPVTCDDILTAITLSESPHEKVKT